MTLAAVNPTVPARKEFATTWSLHVQWGTALQNDVKDGQILLGC